MISATATFRPRNDLGQFIGVVITPAVLASVEASCQLIQATAKEYCPVDTGALRDSIVYSVDQLDATVRGQVGPTMFYASYVEYGTGRRGDPAAPYAHVETWPGMVAQPYMRPAFDESKDAIQDIFRSQIGAALNA